ncbi:MAG: nitroreductase family protein [Thermoplasmatota archaeon]
MKLIDAIKKRRSIRKFTDEDISQEEIKELIQAARWAPSGGNLYPWIIKAVTGKEAKKISQFSPGVYGDPPVLLVFCIDEKKFEKKGGDEVVKYMDIAIAGQNICLKAMEMDLGSCFIRSFNKRAVSKILELDRRYNPELIITIGYSEETPKPPSKKSIDELVGWVGWNE